MRQVGVLCVCLMWCWPGAAEQPAPRLDNLGDPLPEGAVARLGTMRLRHVRGVQVVAISPDGKTIASAGTAVCLWDAKTGKLLRRLDTPVFECTALTFSPDGRLLAAIALGEQDFVSVWDTATGKERFRRVQPAEFIQFRSDSQLLVGPFRGAIDVIDLEKGKLASAWKVPPLPEDLLARVEKTSRPRFTLSPDEKTGVWRYYPRQEGKRLSEVTVFTDADTGKVRFTRALPVGEEGARLVFSPDGKLFALGSSPIGIHETASGRKVRDLEKSSSHPLLFSPDGRKLVWGMNTIFMEDLTRGELGRVPLPCNTGPNAIQAPLAFSSDGRLLALAALESVRLWNTETQREVHDFPGHREEVFFVRFSRDGKRVYTTGGNFFGMLTMCEWQTSDWQQTGRWEVSDFMVASGKVAVSYRKDGLVLHDWIKGRAIHRFTAEQGDWIDATFSPDGQIMVAVSKTEVRLFDVKSGKELRRKRHEDARSNLAFSPDSKHLAWCARDGTYHIENTLTGKGVKRFGMPAAGRDADQRRLFFSRDGTLLIRQGIEDSTVQFWNATTGREVQRFTIPLDDDPLFLSVALSGDNRTLAAGYSGRSNKGEIRLFEVLSGQQRGKFEGHRDDINDLIFSPDGGLLASASSDSTVLIWDMKRPAKVLPASKDLSEKELTTLWRDLAGDASSADDAVWMLTRAPRDSIRFLKTHLKPAPLPDQQRIGRLLADLGSDSFVVRQKAFQELERLGDLARDALSRAHDQHKEVEIQRRIGQLLHKLLSLPPGLLRELRAVQALERIGTNEAREILLALARGAPEARLTQEACIALKRLSK